MRRLLSLLIAIAVILSLAGCSDSKNSSGGSSSMASSSSSNVRTDNEHNVGYQLESPQIGDEIAVMKTNMGDIKLRFFPEAAPKAVENFITHSKNGYYNGVIFHRVIENFMIQGGDPNGTGMGGKSIWGTSFEDEFSDKLFNITGAVAMANSGKNTNGSQFFINQGGPDSFEGWDRLSNFGINMSKITDDIKNLYIENGGNPYLDGAYSTSGKGHTVFAQVFEGMDVVDKIAAVQTNQSNKPLEDVVIETIEVTNYQ
mgnify:CR=1 FL=1